jgi:plastocyanin
VRKALGLLCVLAAMFALVGFTGCGGDDEEAATPTTAPTTTPAGGSKALKISADPSGALKFDKSNLTAKAGKVTIDMDNPSAVPHSIAIEGNGVDEEGTGSTAGVGKGQVSTVTVDLKPGKYTFYCPVPGHEEGGMKGTLTVE